VVDPFLRSTPTNSDSAANQSRSDRIALITLAAMGVLAIASIGLTVLVARNNGWSLSASLPLAGGDTALTELNRNIFFTPSAESYTDRAVYFYSEHRLDDALSDYQHALKLDPEYVPALVGAGDITIEKYWLGADGNSLDTASGYYERAVELDPQDSRAYYGRGLILLEYGDYNAALDEFNKALELDPDDKGGYIGRGLVHYNLNELSEALSDFDQAIRIDPEDDGLYYMRAVIWLEMGDVYKALDNVDRAIELDPDFADNYCMRAEIYEQLGRREDAVADYSNYLSLPHNVESNCEIAAHAAMETPQDE
jgi:tetratricopeptide (TPR) repeat protein